MEVRKTWFKKTVLVLLIGIVVYLLVLFVYRYLNQGLLVVNVEANSPTIIIKNKSGKEIARESSKSLDVKLEKGSYTVEALDSNGGVTSSFADIKARSTTTLKLSVSSLKIPQKIKDVPALDVAKVDNGIFFVQGNSQLLQKVNFTDGSLSSDHVNIPQAKKIEVDSAGNGYLITFRHIIHQLSGSKSKNIRESVLSTAGNLPTPRDIDYHPQSDQLFISAGRELYRLGPKESVAKLAKKTPWAISRISYEGGDWLSIAEEFVPTDESVQEEGEPEIIELRLALLNIKTEEFFEIDKSSVLQNESMSPGGKNLAYYKDGSLVIYNVDQKEAVAKLPITVTSVPEISWCSENKVLYSDSVGVWAYDLGGSNSRYLQTKQTHVTALECTNDAAYIGTFKYPHDGKIYKFLLNSTNNNIANSLARSLPHTGSSVIIDYSFATERPVVNVRILLPKNLYNLRSGDAGYLSAEIFKEQAKKEARQYLKDNGINLNEVKIVYELG